MVIRNVSARIVILKGIKLLPYEEATINANDYKFNDKNIIELYIKDKILCEIKEPQVTAKKAKEE